MNNVVKIYVDGACRGNQNDHNIGAYGVVLIYNNNMKELSKAFKDTTNNRMEILSAIEGLKAMKKYDLPVEVYSDSQYVVNTINEGWNKGANTDLWAELDSLREKFKDIKFIKIKGHSDNKYNNRADQLANIAMNNFNLNHQEIPSL